MLWRFRGWTSDALSTEQIPETNDRVLRILHEVWPGLIAYVLRNCASNFISHQNKNRYVPLPLRRTKWHKRFDAHHPHSLYNRDYLPRRILMTVENQHHWAISTLFIIAMEAYAFPKLMPTIALCPDDTGVEDIF